MLICPTGALAEAWCFHSEVADWGTPIEQHKGLVVFFKATENPRKNHAEVLDMTWGFSKFLCCCILNQQIRWCHCHDRIAGEF